MNKENAKNNNSQAGYESYEDKSDDEMDFINGDESEEETDYINGDESEEETDYYEVFFVSNCQGMPDEETEFGNDYFTRNGIPVPESPAAKPPACVTDDVSDNCSNGGQQDESQAEDEDRSKGEDVDMLGE